MEAALVQGWVLVADVGYNAARDVVLAVGWYLVMGLVLSEPHM